MKMLEIFFIGIVSFVFVTFVSAETSNEQLNNKIFPTTGYHQHPEVPRISAFEAKRLYDQGKLILADAGEPEYYAKRHLIGAISLPYVKVRDMNNVTLPSNFIIAFYCP